MSGARSWRSRTTLVSGRPLDHGPAWCDYWRDPQYVPPRPLGPPLEFACSKCGRQMNDPVDNDCQCGGTAEAKVEKTNG